LLMGWRRQGKIYARDAGGNVDEMVRLASGQVTALLRLGADGAALKGQEKPAGPPRQGDVAVAGSNSGSLSLLRPGFARSGTYESRVLDARSFATWGRASWRTEAPKGTSIALSVRCGNTEGRIAPGRTGAARRSRRTG